MVAVGIGAGILIVILEVLYYKHKGMKKEERDVALKTATLWKERVDKARENTGSVVFTGWNGTENHRNGIVAEKTNPVFESDETVNT